MNTLKSYLDISARARELHAKGALPTRKWTLPLICDHLAKAMAGSAGALGPAPQYKGSSLPVRLVGRILVLYVGYIPKGRPSPDRVLPQSDISWNDAIQRLDDAIAICLRKSQTPDPWLFHPLIGFSDARSWQRFHLVHARHHFAQLQLPEHAERP